MVEMEGLEVFAGAFAGGRDAAILGRGGADIARTHRLSFVLSRFLSGPDGCVSLADQPSTSLKRRSRPAPPTPRLKPLPRRSTPCRPRLSPPESSS